MKTWIQLSREEAMQKMEVTSAGLSSGQAEKRMAEYGKNVLKESKKKSTFQVFLEQFKDLLVIILIAAALISMVSGNIESTVVIFAVIILRCV